MTSRKDDFTRPFQQADKRVVTARFGLREVRKKPLVKDQSIFSYAHRGRGVQGESQN